MLSDLSTGYVNYFDAEGRFRRQSEVDADDELREAIRCIEQAVALEPKLMEARLRLGRLLYRRGDLDRAAQELDAALQLTSQDELRYLALVFRGMVEAARGHYERADSFYTDALRLLPTGQTAAIAKAETAYLRGRVGEAAAIIQATLQRAKKEDPWWVYIDRASGGTSSIGSSGSGSTSSNESAMGCRWLSSLRCPRRRAVSSFDPPRSS